VEEWKAKLKELCGIDIRSLACFRMALALILLGDLFYRVQDLKAHYSDAGVLPRDLLNLLEGNWSLSLHRLSGSWQVELLLFILAALFAVALLVGYKTRLATLFSWFLLVSLHARNPIVLQGGDALLRILLFWGIFLPLGACFSVDQRLRPKQLENRVVTAATLALLLQVCFVYWFSAFLKSDDSWRSDGTAIWYALSIEQFTTSFGLLLLKFPTLLKVLTFTAFYLELLGPFFAFSPFWTAPLRFATAVTFMLFHLVGMNLTMELALFTYVCAAAWIVFIPGWFWERVLKLKWYSPKAIPWRASWLSNGLAVFFILYIFLWNVRTLDVSLPFFPSQANSIGILLGINQEWNMFSPHPLKEDGWYVIPAKLRNGKEVDLFKEGQPVSWQKPPLVSAIYTNDRWRSYMMNLLLDEAGEALAPPYAGYLCREWNSSHSFGEQLMQFDINFMLKINQLGKPNRIRKLTLLRFHCQPPT